MKEKISIENLKSDNQKIVLDTLKKIRKNGEIKHLRPMIDLLRSTKNNEIQNRICHILYDIKEKAAREIIIKEIKRPENKIILKILVSSCWQSAIDYSNYFPVFADIIINEDFPVAFEAFTVIDEIHSISNQKDIMPVIEKIKKNLTNTPEDKKYLMSELIKILENKKTTG